MRISVPPDTQISLPLDTEIDARDISTIYDLVGSPTITMTLGFAQLEMNAEEAWGLGNLLCELTRGQVNHG